ncbi:MAG: hypothetical protein M1565_00825 [Actinobacteria bacterium]|nr:hypothetical protein [Actinomycetota bacterium]MCL5736125.1 hypothetical protein [Actinomycetota bacterium]
MALADELKSLQPPRAWAKGGTSFPFLEIDGTGSADPELAYWRTGGPVVFEMINAGGGGGGGGLQRAYPNLPAERTYPPLPAERTYPI